MSYAPYPKLLYRTGTQEEVWGVMCDVLRVADEAEHEAALAEGWLETPPSPEADEPTSEAPETPLAILDEPVLAIVAVLPQLDDAELQTLLEAETNGKTRKGLIKALDEALADRQAHREVNADLEALGVEFDPRAPLAEKQAQRDEARKERDQ